MAKNYRYVTKLYRFIGISTSEVNGKTKIRHHTTNRSGGTFSVQAPLPGAILIEFFGPERPVTKIGLFRWLLSAGKVKAPDVVAYLNKKIAQYGTAAFDGDDDDDEDEAAPATKPAVVPRKRRKRRQKIGKMKRKAIGARIRETRQMHKETQSDLGRVLGVSKAAISLWETGGGLPNADQMQKISEHYRVSVKGLLDPT
jgi:DNA-binding XRE family transcriptional regulator